MREDKNLPQCSRWCCVLLPTAVKQFLIFSSEVAVRGIPFNLSTQEDVIVPVTGSPSFFIGIDFDAQEKTIFFSDTSKDMIYKQNINGTGENTLKFFCTVCPFFNNTSNLLTRTYLAC